MTGSRGPISVYPLFNADDEMKISNPEPHVRLVVEEFLKIGEAVAKFWIEMPRGILLLQMAPENPASGGIYVYDRTKRQFYMICFEGPDDNLTPAEFEQLTEEYRLLTYLEDPSLLHALASGAAKA